MEIKKAVHLVKIIRLKQATNDYIKIDKEDAEAIDTILEELDNRIPRKKVEELLEEIRKEYFDLINGKDKSLTTKNIITHQYNAMETVLEELLNKE